MLSASIFVTFPGLFNMEKIFYLFTTLNLFFHGPVLHTIYLVCKFIQRFVSLLKCVNKKGGSKWVESFPVLFIFIDKKLYFCRYYLGLGVSSVLLSTLSCLGFGILCGYCGKRPDLYSEDCCDKGTASR